jgi:hypothetical protein
LKDGKKRLVVESSNKEKYLFYKFDDEYFLKESECSTIFKIPFQEKSLENIENKNEPVYKAIMLLTANKFYNVVKYLYEDSLKLNK